MNKHATVVGAGLAGCEAAWALASRGVQVSLWELKPLRYTPAHHYPGFAELVCSNSLKAMRLASAAGLLKEEMRCLGSLTLACAQQTSVPAGGALAVDRVAFSDLVTEKIRSHPLIRVESREATSLPGGPVVVATGPLTSPALSQALAQQLGQGQLSFYDAAAPIVEASSIDMERAFFAARYGRGGQEDYINCPFDREGYEAFVDALLTAQRAELHDFDQAAPQVYEGCMPVEVLAGRGRDALRFGPMKPVGLRDPATGRRPWAVVQLRRENTAGTLYNLVGFQTNLKFGEQKRVFSMIPGLGQAVFARYGVMHRNTFLDSPRLLDRHFRLKSQPGVYFAGQLTGVEGYMESAASGLAAGINLARALDGKEPVDYPQQTMIGALSRYISDPAVKDFQPMGANMGLLPPLEQPVRDKAARYEVLARRALAALGQALAAAGEKAPQGEGGEEG